MNDLQEFDTKLDARIARGFFYVAKNAVGKWDLPSAISLFGKMVELYIDQHSAGRVSDSAFSIIERELVRSGELRPIVVEDRSSAIQKKIADFENGRISTYEFRLACKQDRELRDAFERHTGLAQLASPAR